MAALLNQQSENPSHMLSISSHNGFSYLYLIRSAVHIWSSFFLCCTGKLPAQFSCLYSERTSTIRIFPEAFGTWAAGLWCHSQFRHSVANGTRHKRQTHICSCCSCRPELGLNSTSCLHSAVGLFSSSSARIILSWRSSVKHRPT